MKKVAITEVEPGQPVLRPVTTANGTVMLQAGAVLTPEIAARLSNLGVDSVWIAGESPDAKPVEKVLEELERRFVGLEDDPLMMELKAVVAGRIRQGVTESRD